jgi:hypothetical protein
VAMPPTWILERPEMAVDGEPGRHTGGNQG